MESMGLGGCVVSKNIIEGKGNIKWCIKEQPVNELDNGWRFLADIDTDEYLSDAANMVICDWGTIVNIEPAVITIYYLPVGTDLTLKSEENKKRFINTKTGMDIFY